ncbi:MAG: photosynthetic complex putative assembly protein PuhB [Erythrobacter sp.]|uniref:photosynthetic complex putative assembly protein PuhB n=1 Tax=Erythrobacter sp. TaxID=1042 RepID=UPI00260BE4CB|nr:photosynthetic complex putative assembly protein PuhB [Erythrobacter sp.]MDJ0979618.1 photosynthetic complex putative assembly protein PuhB [Erythrobacter sp.]
MIENRDHPSISEADGPSAHGDPMGTPALDERVLWKGRPSVPVLTRTAFHLASFALYMAAMVLLALFFGNTDSAVFLAGMGLFGGLVIQLMAWRSARSTLYILTDARLILRIGMAVETRINIPLKHIEAAHLNMRGREHGDIAVELGGERLLGYFLMWPHVRPWRFARPQPMLRAVPDAQSVAQILAEACGQHTAIARNLTDVKEAGGGVDKPGLTGVTA